MLEVRPLRKHTTLISAVASGLLLQGCGDPTLIRLSSQLAQQSDGASNQVETYYTHLNQVHRKLYIDELDAESAPELSNIQKAPRTGLTGEYPSEIVRPRVKMAELVGAYAQQIYNIAAARNQPSADQSINRLSTDAQSIGSELLSFAGKAAKLPTAAITALVAPLQTLASLGWQGAFSAIRTNWAKNTITRIDAGFENVCENLDRDLTNSTDDALERAKNVAHLRQIIYDRRVARNISSDEKTQLATQLAAAGSFCDSVSEGNPAEKLELSLS